MADTPKTVAERLREYVRSEAQKRPADVNVNAPVQREVGQPRRGPKDRRQMVETYRERLGTLSDDECAVLDSIIKEL